MRRGFRQVSIRVTLISACLAGNTAHGTDENRFICTVLSDQQKGTVITFDTASRLLRWGDLRPYEMTVTRRSYDPLEIRAESRSQPKMGLHIWAIPDAIRFQANAEDSLFQGTCERH